MPACGNWSSSELVAPAGEPFGGATLLGEKEADRAVNGQGGSRRKTWEQETLALEFTWSWKAGKLSASLV